MPSSLSRKRSLGETDAIPEAKRVMVSGAEARQQWLQELHSVGVGCSNDSLPTENACFAVIGAYNSGKSALLNEFVGESVLTTAPVEQTREIWAIVRPGERVHSSVSRALPSLVLIECNGALSNVSLLDTPGYGGVDGHDSIESLLPLCQTCILCISSQTPVTAQDVEMASKLVEDGRRVIVVLTKADLARDAAELNSVLTSVRSRLAPALKYPPRVFAVAASPSHAESGHFELLQLMEEVRSLANPTWIEQSLIRSASTCLRHLTQDAIGVLMKERDQYVAALDRSRKAANTVNHVCDELAGEISLCRQRVQRQAHDLKGCLLQNESALSAPLVSFRRQVQHATEAAEQELRVLLNEDVFEKSRDELSLFRKMSVEIVRAAEIEMDAGLSMACTLHYIHNW